MKAFFSILILFNSLCVYSNVSFESFYDGIELKKGQKIGSESYKSPIYEKLQLRLKKLSENTNTFSLRLNALGFGQSAKEDKLASSYNQLANSMHAQSGSSACLQKNMLFLEAMYLTSKIKSLEKIEKNYQDLTSLLARNVGRGGGNLPKLLKVKEELLETQIEKSEIKLLDKDLLLTINGISTKKLSDLNELNFEKFIRVNELSNKISEISIKNLDLEKLQFINDIKKAEYQVEKIRDAKILDYVQVSQTNDFESSTIGFEVGFNISDGSRSNSASKALAWHKSQIELNQYKREKKREQKFLKNKLRSKILNYTARKESSYLKDLARYKNELLKSKQNSPLEILLVTEKMLSYHGKLIDDRYDVTEEYLYALYDNGKLKQCDVSTIRSN